MKPRSGIVGIALVAAVAGVAGWWWFTRSEPITTVGAPAPGKTNVPALSRAAVPASNKATTPAPLAPQGVVLPTAPPAPAAEADPKADPQADLKTVIPHMARLMATGDFAGFYEAFTPPDKFDPAEVQHLREVMWERADQGIRNPQWQAVLQRANEGVAKIFGALASQTPTFNAAGDEATYMLSQPDGETRPFVFVKIKGRWYRKPSE